MRSGHEQRNSNWATARLAIDLGYGGKTQADTDALRDFFHAVQGRAHGFRVKDWTDFEAKTTNTTAQRLDAERYQLHGPPGARLPEKTKIIRPRTISARFCCATGTLNCVIYPTIGPPGE